MSKTPRTDGLFKSYEADRGGMAHIVLRRGVEQLEAELADARAEIEAQMKEAYINGYEKGHFDTCEGNYGHIEEKAEDFLAALAAEGGK